jgi:hypothetical protein
MINFHKEVNQQRRKNPKHATLQRFFEKITIFATKKTKGGFFIFVLPRKEENRGA